MTTGVVVPEDHPLADGRPPDWASGWGQDRRGVFAEFEVDGVVSRLRWIRPGRFLMGSPPDEAGYRALCDAIDRYRGREEPQIEITFDEGFWLMDAPVTQALHQAVTGDNPARFQTPDRPVEQVSFEDATAFIDALNRRIEGLRLRLPSEAEWEYACRAGTTDATWAGPMEILGANNAPVLDAIAWYGGNSGVDFDLKEGEDSSGWSDKQRPHDLAGTRRVRRKRHNPWGLHDMLGNVWEWCADDDSDSHEGADPSGKPRLVSQEIDAHRVIRGGSWYDNARDVRAAHRDRDGPGTRYDTLGFRCARGRAPDGPGARPARD